MRGWHQNMNNRELSEKVYLFGQEAKKKNSFLGARIMDSVSRLLAYPGQLEGLIEPEVAQIRGLRSVAPYITRVMQGESYESILQDIPARSRPTRRTYSHERNDQKEWDGSWDNSVRIREEES